MRSSDEFAFKWATTSPRRVRASVTVIGRWQWFQGSTGAFANFAARRNQLAFSANVGTASAVTMMTHRFPEPCTCRRNEEDYPAFEACVVGPCDGGSCPPALYDDPCCNIMDSTGEGDVDLEQFTAFQQSFPRP
jgi:hypothetical protein